MSITILPCDAEVIASLEANIPEFDHPHSLEAIVARLAGRRTLLLKATFDGADAGYKAGYEDQPGTFYSWVGGVLPDYRRHAIAQRLLEHQEAWCVQQGYRWIRVSSENRFRAMLMMLLKNGYDIDSLDMRGRIGFRKRLG